MYFTYSTLFLICVKKQNIWKIAENGALFVIKASIMLMTSSKQKNIYYFKSNCFNKKQHKWLMFL